MKRPSPDPRPLIADFNMKILLHICCANCAVSPARILREEGNRLTGFWFNPNIHPFEEYRSRLDSLKLLADKRMIDDIYFIEQYKPEEFFEMFGSTGPDLTQCNELKSLNSLNSFIESAPPSPERCRSCYMLRLEKTAEQASKQGFNAFSTTLLISPYQDFEQISKTGNTLAEKYNVSFHLRDFRPSFRASMAAAKEFGFYRQKYCGCIYSLAERRRAVKVTKPVSKK